MSLINSKFKLVERNFFETSTLAKIQVKNMKKMLLVGKKTWFFKKSNKNRKVQKRQRPKRNSVSIIVQQKLRDSQHDIETINVHIRLISSFCFFLYGTNSVCTAACSGKNRATGFPRRIWDIYENQYLTAFFHKGSSASIFWRWQT